MNAIRGIVGTVAVVALIAIPVALHRCADMLIGLVFG